MVLRGIGRLDMGLAALGGLGIVILAMVIDRVTQASIGQTQTSIRWTSRGPTGLIIRWISKSQLGNPPGRDQAAANLRDK